MCKHSSPLSFSGNAKRSGGPDEIRNIDSGVVLAFAYPYLASNRTIQLGIEGLEEDKGIIHYLFYFSILDYKCSNKSESIRSLYQ